MSRGFTTGCYDTTGINEWKTDGFNINKIGDLANGIYLVAGNASSISVSMGLSVGASVVVPLIASFTAFGGITGTFTISLSPTGETPGTNNVHWNTIESEFLNTSFDELFALTGTITANCGISAQLFWPLGPTFEYTIGSVVLYTSPGYNGTGSGPVIPNDEPTTETLSSLTYPFVDRPTLYTATLTSNAEHGAAPIGEVGVDVLPADNSGNAIYGGWSEYLGEVPVVDGQASFTVTLPAVGHYDILTDYGGNGLFRDLQQDNIVACAGYIYVDEHSHGFQNLPGTGSSWSDAYTTLGPAAAEATPGSIIEMAAGDYTSAVTLTDVSIEGGFAPHGTTTVPAPNLYVTTLDGSGNGGNPVVTFSGGVGYGAYQFQYGLYGVTVTGGNVRYAVDDEGGSQGGKGTITDCVFANNSAGALLIDTGSGMTLVNCLFTNNTAPQEQGSTFYGSAIFFGGQGTANIANCTFTDNTVQNGGDTVAGGYPNLTNCILWNNGGGEIDTTGAFGSRPTLVNCDVDQNGFAGSNNNIDVNPEFVGTGTYPYELTFPSLCINGGINTPINGLATDLVGNARILPANGLVDMGAYEYQGPFTIYVDQSAFSGKPNGSSWPNAFGTLGLALAVANSGDTIDVAAGDYAPSNITTGTFQLIDGVTIQGGYEPGGAAGPYPQVFVTDLDGSLGAGGYANNVVTGSGTNSTAVLDGFTIKNGRAVGGNGGTISGGGLLDINGSPKIVDCVFTSNQAQGEGGGIENYNSSSPILVDCTFTGNTSGTGGAIADDDNSSPLVADCVFYGNSSGDGGAIYDGQGSVPTISNCSFTQNSALFGGAIASVTGATISNSIMWNDPSGSQPSIGPSEINGPATVTNSDVDDGGEPGAGNIDADPLFADGDPAVASNADLQLQNGSPAIRGGAPQTASAIDTTTGIKTDLAGKPRIEVVTDPTNKTRPPEFFVDMGAYEFQGPTTLIFGQSPPATVSYGAPFNVIVSLQQNGENVSGDTSMVTLSIASGPTGATLVGTLQETVNDYTAQFNISIMGPVGTYKLKATDGNDTSATSTSFAIPGATGLSFIQEPTSVAPNKTMAPAVQVGVFQNGSLDTGDPHTTVTLSIGQTFIASADTNQGVAYFGNLIFPTAGAGYQLTATDSAYGPISITSTPFTVGSPNTPNLVFGAAPVNAGVGAALSPAITVTQEVNGMPMGDNSMVTLSIAGPGGFIGSLSAQVNTNTGVATFPSLIPTVAGAYVITAIDGNDTNLLTLNFSVNQGVEHLVFTTQPPSTYAVVLNGPPLNPAPTVEVENSLNAVVSNTPPDTILIQAYGTSEESYGGTTQVPAIGGSATFNNLFVGGAGGTFFEATDMSDTAAIPAYSNTFTVTPGTADKLFLDSTSTATAGASFAVAIDAEDIVQNLATGYSGDYTFTLISAPAGVTLGTTYDATFGGGVGTINDIVLDKVGSYTLQSQDSSVLSNFNSITFSVSAGAPAQLAFIQQPAPATVGIPFDPTITVAVDDQFGNLVTTDTSTLTLSVATPTGAQLDGVVTVAAQDGIATFDQAYTSQIGTLTLLAQDGSDGINSATSNPFTVAPLLTLYVDQNATGSNDGMDWPDAFPTLQQALAIATPGDTIEMAQGDYSPGADLVDTFQLLDGMTIQGGYQTGGFGVSNPAAYPTILDGTNTNYHVVTGSTGPISAILEDITIANGNADGDGDANSGFGGGLFVNGGSTTISNCTFTTNTAVSGGAIYLTTVGSSSTTVIDTSFDNNTATTGGAMYNLDSSPTLVNDIFVGNANAILNYDSSPTLTNCTLTENTGYAVENDEDGSSAPTLTNCILWDATASEITNLNGAAVVNYSDIDGGYDGTQNINEYPQFARIFNLQIGSPAVDAGSISAPGLDGTTTDIAGQPRIVNNTVDMGAYEGPVPAVIYVDASDVSGADDGLSWADAFTNLQSALSAALPGYTVEVAQGYYSPGSNPTDTFQLLDGVTIQGGYETAGVGGPDAAIYPAILDGFNTNYHVVTANDTDSTAVLEGFTIKNGNASGNAQSAIGGGLIIEGASPTITDCIFTDNSASTGGAIYSSFGSLTINDCTFTSNSALTGGAIYDSFSNTSTPGSTLIDCVFQDNTAVYNGGALENYISSSPALINCLFFGNSAPDGGAIVNYEGADPTLTNCTFTENSSTYDIIDNEASSSSTLVNCILWNNYGASNEEIGNDGSSGAEVINSDIDGFTSFSGYHNINVDPMFVDPSQDNFQLAPTSPCINAGQNSAAGLSTVTTDLAGNPRIFDSIVDMGAYEAASITVYWTGADDGINWSDPGNWSDNLVPNQSEDVTIGPEFSPIQIIGGLFQVHSLTTSTSVEITSGATLDLYGQSTFGGPLMVDSGGLLQVVADPRVLVVNGSSFTDNGTIDLGDNDMIIQNGNLSAITALIATGFNGGYRAFQLTS